MANAILNDLNAIHVKRLHRVTMADGKLLNYYILQPLYQRDQVIESYMNTYTDNSYHCDPGTENIYHYINGEKNYDVHIKDNVTLSAYNVTAQSADATTITAVNYKNTNDFTITALSATTISGTDLRIENNFNVNMFSLGGDFTSNMPFTAVIDKVITSGDAVEHYITQHEDAWSSISAIKFTRNGSTITTISKPMLKLTHNNGTVFAWNSTKKILTISVEELQNPATVENSTIIFTNPQ